MGALSDGDLPLVATTGFPGGCYEAESYMAGWEMGEICELLSSGQGNEVALSIRAENFRQADLLAMALGYVLDTQRFEGGIVHVTFRREII